MRPQDIVVLLKILCYGSRNWYSKDLANDLSLSTAEISNAIQRCQSSGLLEADKKKVRVQSLLEFLRYGVQYVFPQSIGNLSRGIATAHSHPFMKTLVSSGQIYVWPDATGSDVGVSLQPLFPGVAHAAKKDDKLYLMLALVDVLRIGKIREKEIAANKLKELIES